MKIACCSLAGIVAALGLCQVAFSQDAEATVRFEVATIKRSMPLGGRGPSFGILVRDNRVDISLQTIGELIAAAYRVRPYQITGPEWLVKELKSPGEAMGKHVFDINALMPEGGTRSQMPAMLETLLKDRFGMVTHREQRDFPVYTLRVENGGTKLKPGTSEDVPSEPGIVTVGSDNGEPQSVEYMPNASTVWLNGFGKMQQKLDQSGFHIEASNLTMDRLAQLITPYFDRPVTNATGLNGGYQVVIDIGFDEWKAVMRAAGAPCLGSGCLAGTQTSDPSGKSLRASIRNMGLRLVSENHPIDVIVVDHIEEWPTEN